MPFIRFFFAFINVNFITVHVTTYAFKNTIGNFRYIQSDFGITKKAFSLFVKNVIANYLFPMN